MDLNVKCGRSIELQIVSLQIAWNWLQLLNDAARFDLAKFEIVASFFEHERYKQLRKRDAQLCASPWERLVKSMSRDNARDKIAYTCLLYDDCDDDYSCLSFRDVRVRGKIFDSWETVYVAYCS